MSRLYKQIQKVAIMSNDDDKKIIHLMQVKAAKKFAAGHGMSEQEYYAYLDRLKPEQTSVSDQKVPKNNDSNASYVFPLLYQVPDDNQ